MAERSPILKPSRIAGSRALKLSDYGAEVSAEHGRASSTQRGYGSRWQKARLTLLRSEPLCRPARILEGRVEPATVGDHWYPHCGLQWLFWLRPLWVPMSKTWHDGPKAEIEARGEVALDEIGRKLGVVPLSELEPVRIWEWRAAFADQRLGRWT